jgi:hypothetical protein
MRSSTPAQSQDRQALRLTIPRSVLVRADHILE